MKLLKQIFNWFKLFLALDCIGVSIAILITGSAEFKKGPEKWGSLLLVFSVFFLIGIFLLVWFYKTRKKHKANKRINVNAGPESAFCHNYPIIANLFDGWSFNGFGSNYFTYSDKQPDDSLYATKWIIFAFLPIVPLYRERIKVISDTQKIHIPFFISSSSLKYTVLERVTLDNKRIIFARLFYYIVFLPGVVVPLVLFFVFLREVNAYLPGSQLWYILICYFVWGIFLFFLAESFNKKCFLNSNNRSK